MAKEKVSVSNDLIRAVQRLSLNEKRLVMLAVSRLDNDAGIGQLIKISATEYSEFYGIQRDSAYKTLKAAKKYLWNREFHMPEIDGGVNLRWIISYTYDQGSISLKFHPDLDGHIVNLKERFTRYLLSRAADFKYLYSWRLFELIIQFRKTGILKISVDKFKKIMEVPEAYDKDFGIVRRKVINLAIKEIKEKDGLDIKLEVKKKGRTITDLIFTFPVEQQKTIPLDQPKMQAKSMKKPVLDKTYIEKHARPGESWEQASRRLQEELRNQKKSAA